MTAQPGRGSSGHESRLEQVLAEYLHAVEAGQTPDREQFIARHPDLADELKSFFANRSAMERLAEPLRGAALEPTIVSSASGAPDESLRIRYFGDYELLGELGRGGMGVVYKARQTTLNRLVALKMILAGQLAGSEDVLRFKQEAEASANLDHPHIAPIYETGEHEGRHYFSMKLIEGRSLRDALPDLQNDVRVGVKLLSQVARAVHHAHQRGVLHRDLKPANVLLDREGTPYVTDFGLSKRVDGGSDVSKSGAIIGTPSYMAPEQARAEKVLTTAVDVYGLGAMLYELLTGEPPFRAASPLETLLQVTQKDVSRPRSVKPHADLDLETVALKCLEKDPARRYDSAAALADDLDRWLRNEPIVARRASSLERLVKWARRRPASAGILAVSLASLVVVLGLLMTTNERIRSERNLAVTARYDAVQAEADADAARQLAEQRLYGSQIRFAQSALDQMQVGQARKALEATDPKHRGWEWQYLDGVRDQSVRTIPLPTERVRRMAFSSDGQSLSWADEVSTRWLPLAHPDRITRRISTLAQGYVSGDPHPNVAWTPDRRICAVAAMGGLFVWEPAADRETVLIPAPRDLEEKQRSELLDTTAVVLASDGKQVYHAGGKQLACWNVMTREKIWQIPINVKTCWAIALSPAGTQVAYSCDDSIVRVYDQGTQQEVFVSGSHRNRCTHLYFTADGKRLVSGALGDEPRLWDLVMKQQLTHFSDRSPGFTTILTTDRNVAATAYGNGEIMLWETANGSTLHVLRGHTGLVNTLSFSADGAWLATGSRDKLVKVWDVKSGKLIRTLIGHSSAVTSVCFSPDGNTLASAGDEYQLKLWDMRRPTIPLTLAMAHGNVNDWSLVPPQQLWIAGNWLDRDQGGAAFLFDLTTGDKVREVGPHGKSVQTLGLNHDGTILATAGAEGTVRVWDATNGEPRHTLGEITASPELGDLRRNQIRSLAMQSDGKRVVAGTFGGIVTCWDVERRQPVWQRSLVDWSRTKSVEADDFYPLDALVFLSGGTRLLVVAKSEAILCHADTGKLIYEAPKIVQERLSWAYTSDGARLALSHGMGASSPLHEVSLIDPISGEVVRKFGPYSRVDSLAIDSRGGLVAVGHTPESYRSATIDLLDTETGTKVWAATGHESIVTSLSFFPDSTRLVSGSMDHTVKLWSVDAGQELLSLPLGPELDAGVQRIMVTPDGQSILATDGAGDRVIGGRGRVMIWTAEGKAE